jgi:hypothetical protein
MYLYVSVIPAHAGFQEQPLEAGRFGFSLFAGMTNQH